MEPWVSCSPDASPPFFVLSSMLGASPTRDLHLEQQKQSCCCQPSRRISSLIPLGTGWPPETYSCISALDRTHIGGKHNWQKAIHHGPAPGLGVSFSFALGCKSCSPKRRTKEGTSSVTNPPTGCRKDLIIAGGFFLSSKIRACYLLNSGHVVLVTRGPYIFPTGKSKPGRKFPRDACLLPTATLCLYYIAEYCPFAFPPSRHTLKKNKDRPGLDKTRLVSLPGRVSRCLRSPLPERPASREEEFPVDTSFATPAALR
jgi:hypothetical protein